MTTLKPGTIGFIAGIYANDGLIEANDGDFYGTTFEGGTNDNGTVFKMDPQGDVTTLFCFTGEGGPFPGEAPTDRLMQGNDGNLYGTCHLGGSRGFGNVFRILMPGPLLSCAQAGAGLVLSWRTNYGGFTLQSAQDLSAGNWTDRTNAPVILGGQFVVTNPVTGPAGFFRLKQ